MSLTFTNQNLNFYPFVSYELILECRLIQTSNDFTCKPSKCSLYIDL